MKSLVAPVLLVALSNIAFSQESKQRPAFEVASIKPSGPNPVSSTLVGMDANAGMVRYTNISLRDCIRTAYRVRDFQIQGPDWLRDARYEITAKLGGNSQDQIPEMLQSLLEDRFNLALGRSTKDQPVYALVLGKAEPNLKLADAQVAEKLMTALGPDGGPRPVFTYQVLPSGLELRAPAANFATLAEFLSRAMERPVVDMTGLSSQYDLAMTFIPEIIAGMPSATAKNGDGTLVFREPGPTLFEAVQQLGLKLEARKVPMEMLTVVRVEKSPTEN